MPAHYIPERGDLVWLNFDPQAGHEQAGRRPAFVLSPTSYNGKTGLMLCCPITTKVKGYPFEVALEGNSQVRGVILADQVKSLDWQVRKAEQAGITARAVVEAVVDRVKAILEG